MATHENAITRKETRLRSHVKLIRLLVAAGIGVGIALLQYGLLLAAIRVAYYSKIAGRMLLATEFVLLLFYAFGLRWLIGKAKNRHDDEPRN